MKLAIDCRYLCGSGIGRVLTGMLENLDYGEHEFYLVGKPELLEKYGAAAVIEDNSEPYSKAGLTGFQKKRINKECDALIIPNFLIPFGIKIPVHTVMHDLIFLDLPQITTKGLIDRVIKKHLLKRCMKRSRSIACVSAFTKERCEHYYAKYAKKCYVNYNGLSKSVLSYDISGMQKQEKIVYVGNVKPHKGLKTLIEAYRLLPEGKYTLKIIGEKENFLMGMKESELAAPGVEFTGRLYDDMLLKEIASAKFLVQPSLYEGFGLTPLEALFLETKPIISDIPVFREIYNGYNVVYFEKGNAQDLAEKLLTADPASSDCREQIKKQYHYRNFVNNIMAHLG